jgi:hypothetical protein
LDVLYREYITEKLAEKTRERQQQMKIEEEVNVKCSRQTAIYRCGCRGRGSWNFLERSEPDQPNAADWAGEWQVRGARVAL